MPFFDATNAGSAQEASTPTARSGCSATTALPKGTGSTAETSSAFGNILMLNGEIYPQKIYIGGGF